jgi:hypothetical protein
LFRAENLLSSRALSWKHLAEEFHLESAGRAARLARIAKSIASGKSTTVQPTSRSRALPRVLGCAALVVAGVIEIARGESLGIVFLVLGITLAALEYRRQRRG